VNALGDGQAAGPTAEELAVACVDGGLVPVKDASIPVTDEGLLRGDGVFEVIHLYQGRPFALEEHLARMSRSAVKLRLPLSRDDVRADVVALLEAVHPGDALLRLVATRGGHRIALVEPMPDLPASVSVGYVIYSPTRILDGIKSLSYAANMLAGRLARERGYDEALLVTPHGRVLEGPTASLFWVRKGELFTPPLSDHILQSITRGRVIDVSGAREQATTRESLSEADEIFLASTVREVMPVHEVEGRALAAGGPVTREVAAAVARRIRDELELPA
jgi:branched-chain amino acid aminotransferase